MHTVSRIVARHPLACYAVLSAMLSWWIAPLNLSGFPVFPFGPDLAALTVVAATAGLPGVRGLLSRLRHWRTGIRYYVFALAVPALVGWFAVLATHARHPLGAALPGIGSLLEFVTVLPVMVLIGGALGEEVGWRGYLLPALQQRHRPLVAVGLVAVLHLAWHLPLFAAPDGPDPAPFALELLGGGVVLAWLVNRTGLLWPAIVTHGAHNMAQQAFMSRLSGSALTEVQWWTAAGWLLVAAVLIVTTRARLGRSRPEDLREDGSEQVVPSPAGRIAAQAL